MLLKINRLICFNWLNSSYDLATGSKVDIKVVDVSGKIVLESKDENPEGNYFIRKELLDGTYVVHFSNCELNEQFRIIVKN